jgi:hypothetical protein
MPNSPTCRVCQQRTASSDSHRRETDAHWACFARYRKEFMPSADLTLGIRPLLDVLQFLEHQSYVMAPESSETPRGRWIPRVHVLTRNGAPVRTLIGGGLHGSREGADEIAVKVARGWIESRGLQAPGIPGDSAEHVRARRIAPRRPPRGLWSSTLTPRGAETALFANA